RGNREQGTGNRKEVSDNFTFRYLTYVGFFPFTYLLKYLTVTEKNMKSESGYPGLKDVQDGNL
ncbi:MAG: hypothetical protein RLZZ184_2645, partial [Cyanobacteriota bacterium]